MKALVLAAGFGTRLLPLTTDKSKVALSLAGVPVIVRVVRMLRSQGVNEIVVNLHHAPETVRAALAEAGEEVDFSPEPEILGTGGAIRGARRYLAGGPFLLVNGDCFYGEPDLDSAVEFHQRMGAVATMLLLDMPPGESYRPVAIDRDSRLVSVAGRPQAGAAATFKCLHFPGIHVFEPEVIDLIEPGKSDVNCTLYPRLIEAGAPVFGFHTALRWFDLGTPARFLEAAFALLQEDESVWGRGVKIGRGYKISADAELTGPVELGQGCRVGPGCRLERVVAGNEVQLSGVNHITNCLIGDCCDIPSGVDFSGKFICNYENIMKLQDL